MNSFFKLLYLNCEMHTMMEEKISIDLLTCLYSTQFVAEGKKRGQIRTDVAVSQITNYYAMCERALVSDWCLNKGEYSLGQYNKECMPIMMERFKA